MVKVGAEFNAPLDTIYFGCGLHRHLTDTDTKRYKNTQNKIQPKKQTIQKTATQIVVLQIL